MIITTTDPITGQELIHPETKPYVVEGCGHLAIKIYFESEATRRKYLLTNEAEQTGQESSKH